MVSKTKIEWAEITWNPIIGCSKVSPGCKFCYAERMAHRLRAMGQPKYANGFELTIHEESMELPLKWKQPRTIFVNSMSDLFHHEVPEETIQRVFDVMCRADWHQYQILTKRSERLMELSPRLPWQHHIWMGVSVENSDYTHRIENLRQTQARIKFLSLEPLLGPLQDLNLQGIDWVIVGGESGPKARPMKPEWVIEVRDQCVQTGVSFFFKQWGGKNKKKAGRVLEGKIWDEKPSFQTR